MTYGSRPAANCLVVERDVVWQGILCRALDAIPGLRLDIQVASSGEMALEHVTKGAVDLMLLDVSLDSQRLYKFGRELLVTLRSRGFDIPPTLVVSGSEDFEDLLDLFNDFRDCVVRFVPKTSFMNIASRTAFNQSVVSALGNPALAVSALRRFEAAMRRWRWDSLSLKKPVRWEMNGEREVQDVLWLVLRSQFDDVVDEETLPKLGHSSYRPDFGVPSLRLLIEVKYARSSDDFKRIEQEVIQDSVGYLANTDRYTRMIVFVYDSSGSVQEHTTTQQALRAIPGIAEVVIVSSPSHLR